MLERTSFDTPILPRLQTIVAELQSGSMMVPEFQRPFVWNDERRLALLDSIVKGLPIGSLLVWRTSTERLSSYPAIAGITVASPVGARRFTYLIDGHQRISTLFGALVRPVGPRVAEDGVRWPVYLVLGTAERPAFRFLKRNQRPEAHWLPLDIILDGKALSKFRDALYTRGEDAMAEEVEQVANVFKDYIVPIVPLVTEDLDLVTDAFVRINSRGAVMDESHMLRALTYLKPEYDTFDAFARVKSTLEPLGFGDLSDQHLVNSLKVLLDLDLYRSSVTQMSELLKREPTVLSRLESATVEAVHLLRSFGVRGLASLPYAHHLITLTKLAAEDPGSLSRKSDMLRRWFWRTTYTEHFSGQAGAQIRRELKLFREADGVHQEPDIAPGGEIAPLRTLRRGTVRTRAFLLFLARLPGRPGAADERAELLGRAGAPAYLFPGHAGDPGNAAVAEVSEIHQFRTYAEAPGSSPPLSDEFLDRLAIERRELALVPDPEAFIAARRASLLRVEQEWMEDAGLGLTVVSIGDAPEDDGDNT